MNVLYLINFAGKAGTEKYVENLIRILGKDCISPHLCYNVAGQLSERMEQANVPCKQIDLSWQNARAAAKELAEYCRENSIEVIHAQYPRENIIALMSKKYYSAPRVVFTSHLTLRLEGIKSLPWRLLNKHFTPKNHCIIAVCSEGRDIMIENGVAADRIKVIFNGVEPEPSPKRNTEKRSELGLSEDAFVMTILARFAPEKGLGFLLDVLAAVKSKAARRFCCLICGDGEQFSEIDDKRQAMGLEDECKLLGFRNDTGDILHTSDLYLCSSQCNEAMSFAILEAMNAGLPLVVTDVGGNRELAENGIRCGYVEQYGDVEAFANDIVKIMNDNELRARLSAAAGEKVQQSFNLDTLAHDVYNAYK